MDMEPIMDIPQTRNTKPTTMIPEIAARFYGLTASSTSRAPELGILGSASPKGGHCVPLAATVFSSFRVFTTCFSTVLSFDRIPLSAMLHVYLE